MPSPPDRIQHVVVLMLENRSFDHLLGWPAIQDRQIPVDPGNPAAGMASVFAWTTPDGYRTSPDPGHEFPDVTRQLYGRPDPATGAQPTNDGFVASYAQQHDDAGHVIGPEQGKLILGCFTDKLLPVLRALATSFVVCDRWFASVPGPTWPNRDFVHAGTSMGHVNSPSWEELTWGYPRVRTIYQNLQDAGLSWKVYYHDMSQVFYFRDLLAYQRTNFAHLFDLDSDVKGDALPAYSFIEPRFFNTSVDGANDQHPPHDVREGERLIASVYDSLRSVETVWQQTLLIVTYDEHGGFYDHVAPPGTVNPDGQTSSTPSFGFDHLGVRVPALLVSPWVPAGHADSTVYDHTSILGFVKQHFGLSAFLHERDAAANTFEHLFLDQSRTDAPRNLTARVPSYPSRAARTAVVSEHAQRAPSDYQRRLMALAASFQRPQTQGRAAQVVAKQVAAQQRRAPGGARRPARRGRAQAKKTAPSRGR
jgi:phospholipase C